MGLPVLLKYPWFDEKTGTQKFPFHTVSMLISIATLLGVSAISRFFEKRANVNVNKVESTEPSQLVFQNRFVPKSVNNDDTYEKGIINPGFHI